MSCDAATPTSSCPAWSAEGDLRLFHEARSQRKHARIPETGHCNGRTAHLQCLVQACHTDEESEGKNKQIALDDCCYPNDKKLPAVSKSRN